MMYGGYPRVVLAQTKEKKKSEMDEIYRSYIERDITDLLGVEKHRGFHESVENYSLSDW